MKNLRRAIFLTIIFCAGAVFAGSGEIGTMTKPDTLKAEPYRDARIVASLIAGAPVDILARQGGWYQVTAARQTGWVRMLSVRTGSPGKTGTTSGSVIDLKSGRTGSGTIVSTTGIRSLNESDLKAATFNDTEFVKLETFAATDAEAWRFASEGGLEARRLDYLPIPRASR